MTETDNGNILTKVADLFNHKLRIRLHFDEVISLWRFSNKVDNRPRLVVVTMIDNKIKQKIYNAEKFLKDTGVVNIKNLTVERLKIVKKVFENFKNTTTKMSGLCTVLIMPKQRTEWKKKLLAFCFNTLPLIGIFSCLLNCILNYISCPLLSSWCADF